MAVGQGASRNQAVNSLDERFDYAVTLTMRLLNVPPDRVGDRLLAVELAVQTGFNRRAEQLRAFLGMNWGVLAVANDYLVRWHPEAETVYGFCEPARYAGMESPVIVGGEWFGADLEADELGLKAALAFADARRMQALQTFV